MDVPTTHWAYDYIIILAAKVLRWGITVTGDIIIWFELDVEEWFSYLKSMNML